MKRILVAFVAMAMSTAALADTPCRKRKPRRSGQPWKPGVAGWENGEETEASGLYEVDDAKCKDGQYDIKLDKDLRSSYRARLSYPGDAWNRVKARLHEPHLGGFRRRYGARPSDARRSP